MDENNYEVPAYLLAADTHTALNGGIEEQGFLDSAIDLVSKGIPSTLIAAGNEIANIPATIGNWVTGTNDYEVVTNRQRIADLDDDLAAYYDDHKLGIDTMGFIVGSFVPGMAGTKVLRAGQTVLREAVGAGKMGGFTSNALGLLAPQREKYLAQAISEIGTSGNVFKITEANTFAAMKAGVWQNVLEGAVFTGAVNATMHQSPILDQRSTSDLMFDVLLGGALGGVIGGGIQGIQSYAAIKAGAAAAEKELMPWMITTRPVESASSSDKILFKLQQLEAMPVIEPNHPLASRIGKTAQKTKETLMQEIRGHVGELAEGDQAIADLLTKNIEGNTFNNNVSNLIEAQRITRVNAVTGIEKAMRRSLDAIKKDPLNATKEQTEEYLKYKVAYVNLRDGAVASDKPALLNLPDRLKAGESITLAPRGDGVYAGKTFYKQENNPYRPFNIFGLSHDKVEARYFWSEMLPKWVDDGSVMVHETDIPLLQKAVRDGLTKLKVIPEEGAIDIARTLNSVEEIAAFTRSQQATIAARLVKAETVPQTVDTLVDKLKHYFGINFSTVDEPGVYGYFQRIAGKAGTQGDVIALERSGILSRPLSEIIRTLKHEEGHAIFQSLLDARGISRVNLDAAYPQLKAELVKMSKQARPGLWKSAAAADKAYREGRHELFADSFFYLSKHPEKLKDYPEFNKFAGHLVRPIPQEVLDSVARRAVKPSKAEIAKIVNASEDVLFGGMQKDSMWNARQHAVDTAKSIGRSTNPLYEPTFAKVITKSERMRDVDGNLLEGMAIVAQKETIYQKAADNLVDSILEPLPSSAGMRGKAIGSQTGPGVATSEAGNYGSWSSFFSYVGQRTHNLMKTARERTAEIFNPTLQKLAMQQDDAIEFSVLNERLRGLPNNYFLSDDGAKLMYGKAPLVDDFVDEAAYLAAAEKHAKMLQEASESGFPLEIPMKSPLVRQLVRDHISVNTGRRSTLQKVHANNGYQDRFQQGVFYPIPRNPKDTPFYAFVIDDSVSGTGHSKMIYAKDADTLELMRNEIMSDASLRERGIKVLTKTESEEYFKSIGQFEFERTLSDNYINAALARKGTSQSFIPVTDPTKIVTDFLDWHHARDNNLVRTLVEHKYSRDFSGFRAMAEPAIDASKSKFGYISPLAYAEKTVDNPAVNLMKMALDISKTDEYPLWNSLNKFLDGAFSKAIDSVSRAWNGAKSVDDLDSVYSSLKKAGYTDVISADALAAANEVVPRGKLAALVNKANSILATFALRADPFNALNNTVGHAVLLGTETKAVISAIQKGNQEAVGELAKLMKIAVPGTGDLIDAPSKLIAKQITKFHTDKAGREWFRKHGFISSITDQYDQTLDHIAIALARGDNAAMQKAFEGAKKFGDAAEKYTGNRIAEEFNRYVAAGVMKDITDIAVKHGLMDSRTALTYINTFVNRTQGNYLASQRPVIFQGPLGQAMGLFQTYQFNLLQQVLRHIGDGNYKNVAIMMGLQGGIYGMNGLPAFNAINTHIIGSAGGNPQHQNLYDAMFSLGGKEAGEWLLYGGLSNGLGLFHPDLKTNVYSRGDINPRQLTLVPVNPADVPIVKATGKFFSLIKESYSKIQMGGDVWSTFLRGVEQNGVSRPLTGLAQVLEAAGRDDLKVISTNQQGNMMMAHDLNTLSSLMRILGAKPLDEAIVNDTMFRINTYKTADAAKRKVLGEAVKQSILGGGLPDEEQINEFAESYAKTGGKMTEFGAWMANQYSNANVSQAEKLRRKIGNPYATSLQRIMYGNEGGTEQ